jgi:hypothetical protein
MALQTSGAISISQIKTELGSSSNSLRALSAAAGKSTPDAMSEFYGYSSIPEFYSTLSLSVGDSGSGTSANPWFSDGSEYSGFNTETQDFGDGEQYHFTGACLAFSKANDGFARNARVYVRIQNASNFTFPPVGYRDFWNWAIFGGLDYGSGEIAAGTQQNVPTTYFSKLIGLPASGGTFYCCVNQYSNAAYAWGYAENNGIRMNVYIVEV